MKSFASNVTIYILSLILINYASAQSELAFPFPSDHTSNIYNQNTNESFWVKDGFIQKSESVQKAPDASDIWVQDDVPVQHFVQEEFDIGVNVGNVAPAKPIIPTAPKKTSYTVKRDAPVMRAQEMPAKHTRPVERTVRKERAQAVVSAEMMENAPVIPMILSPQSNGESLLVEVDLKSAVILRMNPVKRFLVVKPDIAAVKKVSEGLQVVGLKRGTTFVHVWDATGRSTLQVRTLLPQPPENIKKRAFAARRVEHVEPFKFSYTNSWGSNYSGSSIGKMDRDNLTFSQWMGIFGETPYGSVDASMNFYKFAESTERVGQRVGLAHGYLGPFEDFTIRGWDASMRFSDLSLPGRSFRGVLLESYMFDKNFRFTYLRGQDRAQFLFLAPGTVDIRKSYIEAGRMTLYPFGKHEVSINWARGWGEARETSLKDRVFSIDTKHKLGKLFIETENAYDEDALAHYVRSIYEEENYSLRFNFRHINKDFRTISSRPSDLGETGGFFDYRWKPGKFKFHANIDLYQDNEFPNPEDDDALNLDFSTSASYPITDTLHWRSSFYYVDTPQMISPRESLRLRHSIRKTFRFLNNRSWSVFLGQAYQRNRFDRSPFSEFDRYSVSGGVNVNLLQSLSYFVNYEYSWVDEISTGNRETPNVMSTGFNYAKRIKKNISTNVSLTYRNEENAEGNFSFLSGEDSVQGGLGVSYFPRQGTELFANARWRNNWPELEESPSFQEMDVRFGVRTTWDTVFRWDPKGFVRGTAYKDINANGRMDWDEPGIENVRILIGDHETNTDSNGNYVAEMRAKKVKVDIVTDSIPEGFVVTSTSSEEVEIVNQGSQRVNFGLTSSTSIFGVVYWDKNDDGRMDGREKTFGNVRITLDNDKTTFSNADGTFKFEGIDEGDHTVVIDINTIPKNYLPKIKLKNEIFVEEGSTYRLDVLLREN